MKLLTTKKNIQQSGYRVFAVGYCGLQFLLKFEEPFAYSVRCAGWACDYYKVGDVIISTGYAPIGEQVDYYLMVEYDRRACAAYNDYSRDYDIHKAEVTALLREFVTIITAEGG
jgi:hypothetical protein